MKKSSLLTLITLTSFVALGMLGGCSASGSSSPKTNMFKDADADGYGDAASVKEFKTSKLAIDSATGFSTVTDDDGTVYVSNDDDCDDSNATVSPGGTEVASDGVDNNCDGLIDEEESVGAGSENESTDDDGDGYTEAQGDTDDGNSSIYPGAPETAGDEVNNDGANEGSDNPTTTADGDGTTSDSDCNDCDAPQDEEKTLADPWSPIDMHTSSFPTTPTPSVPTTSPPSTYAIDGGTMLWHGVNLDFNASSGNTNFELEDTSAYLNSISCSGNSTQTCSATANVKFNKMDSTDEDYTWDMYTSALAFDGDTFKAYTGNKTIDCGADGSCNTYEEIDINNEDGHGHSDIDTFNEWPLADINDPSGRYAFYIALTGFKYDSDENRSMQVADFYVKAYIANEIGQTVHEKDKDDNTGTISNGNDHYTTTDDLRLQFEMDRNGENQQGTSHSYSMTIYYTLIGIDTSIWGTKWFDWNDGSESGDTVTIENIALSGTNWFPASLSQMSPILYGWGFSNSTGYEVNSIEAWAEVSAYDSVTHNATIKVHGDAQKLDPDNEVDPDETKGYLLFCKDSSVCVNEGKIVSDESGGNSDSASTGNMTVP